MPLGRSRPDGVDELFDQRVRRQTVGLGMEVRQHAVDEHGRRQRPDVLDGDRVAPLQDRARLREGTRLGVVGRGAGIKPL